MPLPDHKTTVDMKEKKVLTAFCRELIESDKYSSDSAFTSMNHKVTMNWALMNGTDIYIYGDTHLNQTHSMKFLDSVELKSGSSKLLMNSILLVFISVSYFLN